MMPKASIIATVSARLFHDFFHAVKDNLTTPNNPVTHLLSFFLKWNVEGVFTNFASKRWSSYWFSSKSGAVVLYLQSLSKLVGKRPTILCACDDNYLRHTLSTDAEIIQLVDPNSEMELLDVIKKSSNIHAIYLKRSASFNFKKLKKECDSKGVYFILDQEHTFVEMVPSQHCHATVYSPASTLPIPECALLLVAKEGYSDALASTLDEEYKKIKRVGALKALADAAVSFLKLLGLAGFNSNPPSQTQLESTEEALPLRIPFTLQNYFSNLSDARLNAFLTSAIDRRNNFQSFLPLVLNDKIGTEAVNPTLISITSNSLIACRAQLIKFSIIPAGIGLDNRHNDVNAQKESPILISVNGWITQYQTVKRYIKSILGSLGSIELIKTDSRNRYNQFFSAIKLSNLVQDWDYGETKRREGWVPVRYLIIRNNAPEGVVQVLEKNLLGIRIARVNRGPLCERLDTKVLALKRLKTIYSISNRSILLINPELPLDSFGSLLLRKMGFLRRASANYHSSVIDLTIPQATLRENLDGKWRNLLKNSESKSIEISVVTEPSEIQSLTQSYAEQQREKSFSGIPIPQLQSLLNSSEHNTLILSAFFEEKRIATVVFYIHGTCATYLIGMSDEAGRKINANTLLLWRGIEALKDRQLRALDLGGMDEVKLPHITHFKRGLAGEEYRLCGEWF